jgi:hypothetical protein
MAMMAEKNAPISYFQARLAKVLRHFRQVTENLILLHEPSTSFGVGNRNYITFPGIEGIEPSKERLSRTLGAGAPIRG